MVAEAATFTSARGMMVAVVALEVGMNRAIGDYPLPVGTPLGAAIRLHWQALH